MTAVLILGLMILAITTIAQAGDEIVSSSSLYGGTYNLFAHTLPQYGIEVRWADPNDPDAVARCLRTDELLLAGIETA